MGKLAEAYKEFRPIEHEHLAPIDFKSITSIPESHAWTQSYGSIVHADPNKQESILASIPVIAIDDPNASELIYNACESWGFFRVSNHGISALLLEDVEFQTKKLFSLPLDHKMKALRSPQGATGYGSPRISPFFSKLMWSEGFTIMESSLVDDAKKLWPNEHQQFCDVMAEYQSKMKGLTEKLMGLILKSLQIPESRMNWMHGDSTIRGPSTALQLNSYPSCPDPTSTMGLAPHTDSLLLTILHQSGNASGLEVFKEGLGWARIDPDPSSLVVNVGDLLHIISNGRFPSVLHRAVVNNEKQRISLAYFFGPPLDFDVSPYLGYKGCNGACFKSMNAKEYVGIKAKHLDQALSVIRK